MVAASLGGAGGKGLRLGDGMDGRGPAWVAAQAWVAPGQQGGEGRRFFVTTWMSREGKPPHRSKN